MNTNFRKVGKKILKKNVFKLINSSVFGKTAENNRTHREIKLVTTEKNEKKFGVRTKSSY